MTTCTRRTVAATLAAASLAPLLLRVPSVLAQPAKPRRIGFLSSQWASSGFHLGFVRGLRELGWTEGQNIVIEFRFAEGSYERLPGLAQQLLRLDVEVLVAQPTPAAVAASKATRTVPIVMINTGDPVRLGLVASLARPGGNVTGTTFSVSLETIVKGLELIKEAIPGLRRVAVLSNPGNPGHALAVRDLKTAAQALGLELVLVEARGAGEFESAFAQMLRERAQAMLVVTDGSFVSHRQRLAQLALQHRLPSMHGVRENAEAGGLMSYGPSLAHNSHRAASFVDKILKGTPPAELPVEQPTRFELALNMKTAKALGFAFPGSILVRADSVIE